jgi:dolichol-phosphate mannosyltransferase
MNTMISIVIPAFNEESNLVHIYEKLKATLDRCGMSWELMFVDDGSADQTWPGILELCQTDARVRGVRLSRNFGHQAALLAGLSAARGDAVVSMDADMQHPPELIPTLIEKWRQGFSIVHTIRHDSTNLPLFKRITSRFYYRLFSYLSGVELNPGMADFRLLDRRVLDEILKFGEEGLFLRGIVQWVGFPATAVTYEAGTRHSGETKYTLRKMLRLAWHGVSSFSLVPLRLAILLGISASALSFLGVAYAIVGKLMENDAIPGWASTIAIISVLFGVLFVFLAILAEYIGRILIEARGRPRFLIRDTTPQANSGSVTLHKNSAQPTVQEIPPGS